MLGFRRWCGGALLLVLLLLRTEHAVTTTDRGPAPPIAKRKFTPRDYSSDVPLEVSDPCSVDAEALYHAAGYEFFPGYVDGSGAAQPVTLRRLVQSQRSTGYTNTSYFCSAENTLMLMNITYRAAPSWAVVRSRQSRRRQPSDPPPAPPSAAATESEADHTFNGARFLALLRGKTIAFMGDSMARQHFEALEAELFPHQSRLGDGRSYNGNGSHHWPHTNPEVRSDPRRPAYLQQVFDDGTVLDIPVATLPNIAPLAARRWYPAFSAALVWCQDVGLSVHNVGEWAFCGAQTLARTGSGGSKSRRAPAAPSSATTTSSSSSSTTAGSHNGGGGGGAGVLVVSVGTHFKAANHPRDGFEARRARSVATLGQQLHAFRAHLRSVAYGGHVVWTLKPHHGPFDELTAAALPDYRDDDVNGTRRINAPHYDGKIWDSEPGYETLWAAQANVLIRALARDYGDSVLDLGGVSRQLLRYVAGEGDRTRRAYEHKIAAARAQATRATDAGVGTSLWSAVVKAVVGDTPAATHTDAKAEAEAGTGPGPGPAPARPQVHADSCHYCAGGLFRAANLLLQDVVSHRLLCPAAGGMPPPSHSHDHGHSHSHSHKPQFWPAPSSAAVEKERAD